MKTLEEIAHRAADEIVNTAKQDVDRVEVIVLQAIRDGIKATPQGMMSGGVRKMGKKNR